MFWIIFKKPDKNEDDKEKPFWRCIGCGEVFYNYGAFLRHKCGTE